MSKSLTQSGKGVDGLEENVVLQERPPFPPTAWPVMLVGSPSGTSLLGRSGAMCQIVLGRNEQSRVRTEMFSPWKNSHGFCLHVVEYWEGWKNAKYNHLLEFAFQEAREFFVPHSLTQRRTKKKDVTSQESSFWGLGQKRTHSTDIY